MRKVEDLLIVGVGVDRRHRSTNDSEVLNEDLRERREAVCCARSVANDVVFSRLIRCLVNTVGESYVRVGRWRR